jgi:hypothetical protein
MKSNTFPLAIPDDLLGEVRRVAKRTSLSLADTMRQSMKLGLPKLDQELARDHLKPLTKEERRQCWEDPNPEFDALEHHCASLPQPPPEE